MSFRPLFFFIGAISVVMFAAVPAQASAAIRFSEIAWMGTSVSAADEWIELENTDPQSTNLNGWSIISATDGKPNIALGGSISGNGFYLIERTDDDTVSSISADVVASFGSGAGVGLSNSGETLKLISSSGDTIDTVFWTKSGPGDLASKSPMALDNSGEWQTSNNPLGTPKSSNGITPTTETVSAPTQSQSSEGFSDELPPEDMIPVDTAEPSPKKDVSIPAKDNEETTLQNVPITTPEAFVDSSVEITIAIRISEILPDPEGKDSDDEFVEIQNFGDGNVSLDGWVLRDSSGASFVLSGIIASGQFVVFDAANTTLPSLNNKGDSLELLDPSGTRRDGISYTDAPKGLSLAVTTDGSWEWTSTNTPGTSNRISTALSEDSTDVPIVAAPTLPPPSKKPTAAETTIEKYSGTTLASAVQALSEINTPSREPINYFFFLSIFGSIAVGVIIFFIRRRAAGRQTQIEFSVEEEYTPPVA